MKDNVRSPSVNNDEITLKDIILKTQEWWRFFLSKWIIIAVSGILCAALGFTYACLKKPVYTAQLSFALEDEKSGALSGAAGLASQLGFDLGGSGGGAFSGDNLLGLMKSRYIIESTLLSSVSVDQKQQTLAELYISFNKLRPLWDKSTNAAVKGLRFSPNSDRSTFSLQQDSVLGSFYDAIVKDNLTVDKIDKKLSIITIIFKSKNELFSKYFTETLAKNVSIFYVETKTKKSVQNVTILQNQTDSIRRELNAAINGVASSIDAVPNANPGRQILRAPSQHRQVDVAADQAILTELVKNLEVSKVALRKETPLIQVIDKPILPLEKESFGKTKGIILGGILGVFVAATVLFFRKFYKNIMLA